MKGGASSFFGIVSLVIVAGIIADVLRNPKGTAAASTGVKGLLGTTYNAASGYRV